MMNVNVKKPIQTAIILCGGKSTRAGIDKQTVKTHHTLITLYIAGKLESVFNEVLLVTNKPHLYAKTRYKVVEDIIKEAGPLGGIHSGLVHAKGDIAYVTACDMPNVSLPCIRWMKELMSDTQAACDVMAVKRHNGMIEPFNGFYSKRAIPVIEQLLQCGMRKITDVHNKLNAHYIDQEDIEQFGAFDDLFFNMNWHYQIKAYLARAGSGG